MTVRITEERDGDGVAARVVLTIPGHVSVSLWPEEASEIGHALCRAARKASDLEDGRAVERDGDAAEGLS